MRFFETILVSATFLFLTVSATNENNRVLASLENSKSVLLQKQDISNLYSIVKFLNHSNKKKYTEDEYAAVQNKFYDNSNKMRRLQAINEESDAETTQHRRLQASNEECGIFLAASLAESMWDCFSLGNEVMSLVSENECVTTYNFEQTKMKKICTNTCYNKLNDIFKVMSEAKCSAAILKQSCNECADDEVCVGGDCLKKCDADTPCHCDDVCQNGACQPASENKVDQTNLGINGYKKSMEYLCYQNPETNTYCMADLFNVMNTADVSTFCDKLTPVGCCTGTIFQWATSCALTTDTIMTEAGPISKADLQAFCPEVDFDTICPNAPTLEEGECEEGYFLSSASSWKASSFYLVGAGVSVMMLLGFM